ncbi:hypothetical protein GWR56_04460 [Mucilaginibacter sp. 14171R-50]|uniref:hypothetical protein n=1 Tax=Mucilaginibacter sp. 14171R-50 TaxID=2703789 RepID=UPI00138C5562|nr:hypothetical protein [Mucilaginibacter sp. 14171R-50]QHS54834.1 hypothetical protein GWR56_04460 [Mucilaginibacter sp. 14171R-50]
MKKPYFIFLILLFYSIAGCAQTKFSVGKKTFKKETFTITKSQILTNNQRSWFIFPEKNKYKGPVPPSFNNYQFKVLKSDIHLNIEQVNDIVYGNLKNKRQALHEKNEKLGIIFIFETDGSTANISYTLQENTLITPVEIEQIDIDLRKNIKVTFTGTDYKYYKAVNYAFPYIKF